MYEVNPAIVEATSDSQGRALHLPRSVDGQHRPTGHRERRPLHQSRREHALAAADPSRSASTAATPIPPPPRPTIRARPTPCATTGKSPPRSARRTPKAGALAEFQTAVAAVRHRRRRRHDGRHLQPLRAGRGARPGSRRSLRLGHRSERGDPQRQARLVLQNRQLPARPPRTPPRSPSPRTARTSASGTTCATSTSATTTRS